MSESQKNDLKPFINLVAKLSGAGLSFLMLILLARVMTPADFADFSVLLAWIAIGTTIGCVSMPLALIRHVAEYLAVGQPNDAKGMLLFAFCAAGLVSTCMIFAGFGIYIVADLTISPWLEDASFWIAVLLFTSVILTCLSGFLQGLKRVIQAEVLINLTRPLFLIVAILLALTLNIEQIKTYDAVVYYTIVCIVVMVMSLVYSTNKMPIEVYKARPSYHSSLWIRTASGFLLISTMTIFYEKLDIILISILSTSEATAIYAVATKFSQTIFMAMIAVTAHSAPLLAEKIPQLKAKKTDKLNLILQSTTRYMVLVSGVAVVIFAAFGNFFLRLFGEYYHEAYLPLVILSLGHFVSACFGPSLLLSTFVGETKIALFALCCGLLTNVLLSLFLTPIYEGIGAAFAMAAALAITSMTASLLVNKRLNLYTPIRFGINYLT